MFARYVAGSPMAGAAAEHCCASTTIMTLARLGACYVQVATLESGSLATRHRISNQRLTILTNTAGPLVARFASTYCRQSKGRWADQPLDFEPWQQDLVDAIFTLDENGKRVYQSILIGMPRKNGKSSLAAALALFLAGADGENSPDVVLAAASREQADVVYDAATQMVVRSPFLPDFMEARRGAIFVPDTNGSIKKISADGKLQHGLNPHGVVIDELHSWLAPKHIELYDALTTGSIAREQPMLVAITTAGHDKESILGQEYDRFMSHPLLEQRDGLSIVRDLESKSLFWWYAAPDDADVDDEEAWMIANPASWVTPDILRPKRAQLKEAVFRRLHMNQWTASEEIWIRPAEWAECVEPGLDFRDGEVVWVGVDLAAKHDTSAVVIAGDAGRGPDGRHRVKVKAFVYEDDRPTEMVVRVENKIRELHRHYAVREVVYDPWRFERSAISLSDEGIFCVEFPQTNERMAPASQLAYELVRERRLLHGGDTVLTSHVLAAVAVESERGFRVKKAKTTRGRKIDAAVAMILAVQRADHSLKQGAFYVW